MATARAEDASVDNAVESLAKQESLTDTPDGPKEQLRRIGITTDVWVTQFYQGIAAGTFDRRPARYGGKLDAFLKVDAEKLGLWPGLKINVHYEHYFGRTINELDEALIPINTAQAFIYREGYHSGLSINVSQDIGEHLTVSAGKFDMVALSGLTPLKGGDGIDTFWNLGIAVPISGVTPPYIVGGMATLKFDPISFKLMVYDPRNAQEPRVIERPFEKGTTISLAGTVQTDIFGLTGYQSLRGVYSSKRGIDLADIPELILPPEAQGPLDTKRGKWFASYSFQQYLVQSEANPSVGWGLFALAGVSDGNPNPVKWSVIAGVGGNNLAPSREDDLWGVGFFHYGLSKHLLAGLAALDVDRRSEGGIEAFYNLAITKWLRLSGDLQFVEPWNPTKMRATYAGLRLQTKF